MTARVLFKLDILINKTRKSDWKLDCCCLVTKLCLILCDSMDSNLPGSYAHGISQAKILEWVAIFFSRGSSQVVRWLRIHAFIAENMGSVPGWGTKIL